MKSSKNIASGPPPREHPGRQGAETVRVPVKWIWHYGMLHSLRERLLENLANEKAAASQPMEPHSMDIADSATDEFDHEMALCLLSREQDALREIDAALHRILAGTYGICEETGEPIPLGRLHVVPWTRYTAAAKEKREGEGLDVPAGIPPLSSIQGRQSAALAEAEDTETEELQSREVARHQRDAGLRRRETGTFDDLPRQVESGRPENAKRKKAR